MTFVESPKASTICKATKGTIDVRLKLEYPEMIGQITARDSEAAHREIGYSPPTLLARQRGGKAGYTLIEMLVALIVTGVLLSIGVPKFQQSLEQSRADVSGANLRSIWAAQRLYWLENRTYAPDLSTLLAANLVDPSLPTATTPYGYSIASSSESWFTATATRSGSANWSGTFTIAADGTFSGSVQQAGQGPTIAPGFQ
jgi:prepilin-type N-terminal cleavage/methylation domain-containing protein